MLLHSKKSKLNMKPKPYLKPNTKTKCNPQANAKVKQI